MTDPSSADGRIPGPPPPGETPETADARTHDLWLGRLMRVLGVVIGVGLWLLVAEVIFLRWLH